MGKHKQKLRKHKKEKKHKKYKKQEYSSSSSEEEWVEKKNRSSEEEITVKESHNRKGSSLSANDAAQREDWMSLHSSFSSTSNIDKRQSREETKRLEREKQKYNPRECPRELNPYWKHGGDGLPKFKKPSNDDELEYKHKRPGSSNWRKKDRDDRKISTKTEKVDDSTSQSDVDLNVLASKLIKAEIMGNTKLIAELKDQLEKARNKKQSEGNVEEVVLTQTDSKGQARPVRLQSEYIESNKRKKQKVETHKDGQRVRYFADDDKYSLQQMFENEKFTSVDDQNSEFVKMAGKIRKNDDMDDIFADNIRHKHSDQKIDSKNRDKAINEHKKVSQSVDYCKRCLQSDTMPKHLMVTMGETIYLSLPHHEPLTEGHCFIAPVRHVPCATQLDENEWADLMDFRKSLTRMFQSQDEDVIFFETAMNLHKYPHMVIECVPLPKEEGDLAPIYFKKAIDESEHEWSQNKKLVSLKGKDIRRAVPKGLSYFFVSFGMEEGFAHVIEDEKIFPNNFAQEIIGGMLDLHHSKWRKPKTTNFEEQSNRVLEFSKKWSDFDCTNKT